MTTYFIAAAGSDSNNGTSSATPWQTVGKVNGFAQQPGDFYQFNGGDTFTGTTLIPAASGTVGNPITFQSYGTGQATINITGITADGFTATNASYITVNNLNFTGPGTGAANTHRGMLFNYTTAATSNGITVTNCNVTGFGADGIAVLPLVGTSSIIIGVLIDLCVVNNCTWGQSDECAGIHVGWGNTHGIYQIQNVTVSRSVVHDCPGLSGASATTGSGIFLRTVSGGTVSQCVAYNNCLNGPGAVGIWTFDSQNITFQYCESYNNKGTSGSTDGGGFDLDGGVFNSVCQYCYSHGNWGNGFLIFGGNNGAAPGGATNCIIRFCISQNDGQNAAGTHQGIAVTSGSGQKTLNAQVYGNTVYYSQSTGGSAFVANSQGGTETQVQVFNNIFWATTPANSALVDTVFGDTGLQTTTYAGNDYYDPLAINLIDWNGAFYHSLSSWQAATGQEKVAGRFTGFQTDPLLNAAGLGGTVSQGSFVTPVLLAGLKAYVLQSGSPVIDAGLNMATLFGISPGPLDFFSNKITPATLSVGSDCPQSPPAVQGFIPGREWQQWDQKTVLWNAPGPPRTV